MRTKTSAAAFAASLGLAALAAQGSVINYGNTGGLDDENIQFNDGLIGSGFLVEGATNQSAWVYDFSSTVMLETPSNGQARIEGDGLFDNLLIEPADDDATFLSLILNIDAAADGDVTFVVTDEVGGTSGGTFNLDGNGQNFFTIVAEVGERIRSVAVSTSVDMSDVSQIRIGGTAVPEPASLAVLGLAAGTLLSRRRR